jgi:hypothetical protein
LTGTVCCRAVLREPSVTYGVAVPVVKPMFWRLKDTGVAYLGDGWNARDQN